MAHKLWRLLVACVIIGLVILSGDLYCKNLELKKEIAAYDMKNFTCKTYLKDVVVRKIMCAR